MNEKFANRNRHRGTMMQRILLLLFLPGPLLIAQGSAGSDSRIEPRYLIDLPTAGMLTQRNFALDLDFYQEGGLLISTSVGVLDRLLLGVSYGGTHLLGDAKPEWNTTPGVSIKIRVLDESIVIPALAIGFDSQGKETYIDALSRYTIKSLGVYGVVSKNYQAMGFLSFHGGVNYSFERADGDTDPNIFGGIEKTLGPNISVLAEYNLAWNDSNRDALGQGRGYLNLGVRGSLGGGFTIGFNIKDLIKNQNRETVGNRTLKCEFVRPL